MRRLRSQLPPAPSHSRLRQTVAGHHRPYSYLEECREQLGSRFTLYPLDMPPMVFLSDPSDIRELVTADVAMLHAGAGASIISPLIGSSSFMLLEEDEHREGRKVVAPAFHQRMIAKQAGLMAEAIEREIAAWPLATPIALHPRIRALTLRIILKTIFTAGPELEELHERLMQMLTITATVMLQEPKLRYAPGWHFVWRRFVHHRAAVNELIFALVARRSRSVGEHGDLLDSLICSEPCRALAAHRIRDDLMSMILAGHETTTGELTWAFQLLAHHPSVQERLHEEIDSDAGDEYLTATIFETMRHRPVFVFIIPRKVMAHVSIGGWTYAPPAHLAGCTYLMHHDPALYPDPQRFWPERFIGARAQGLTWLPWGGGRKHCLGRHFALLEVKAILREVLASRVVSRASARIEEPCWRSAIVVPRNGGEVILRKR
ncbi:MAG: cytochrome P450 [Solirubrobacteraceae bacterium]